VHQLVGDFNLLQRLVVLLLDGVALGLQRRLNTRFVADGLCQGLRLRLKLVALVLQLCSGSTQTIGAVKVGGCADDCISRVD
jgi:hypothetical protein